MIGPFRESVGKRPEKIFILLLYQGDTSLSHPNEPKPCTFFCGFIWNDRDRLESCLERSVALWGPVLERSGDLPFVETAYYSAEMGSRLVRTYYIYEPPLGDSVELVGRKHQAAGLEKEFLAGGRRSINLDPGYLNGHQVVIATFKDFAHRIHLGRGVYAHLEYVFKNGEPQALPWTYPDFRREDHRTLFKSWRARNKP